MAEAEFDVGKVLSEIRLFQDLNKEQVAKLKKGLTPKTYQKGQNIITVGSQGDEFFIIASGNCAVLAADGQKVATLKRDDYFGEQALLRKSTRNATIQAESVVEVFICSKTLFESVVQKNVAFIRREAKRKAVLTTFDLKNVTGQQGTPKTDDEKKWIFQCVSENVMFMHLSESQRYLVIEQMYTEDIPAGKDLITQGDTNATTFYVVKKGKFDILVKGKNVGKIPPGGCFGELALMYKAPRAATIRAIDDCQVWTVNRDAFRSALASAGKKALAARLKVLQKVKIFKPLLNEELILLDEAFVEKKYKAETTIFKQGAAPSDFYVIKKGRVKWVKDTGENGLLEAGDFFGELALLHNQPRACAIVVVKDVTVLQLSQQQFTELLGPLKELMDQHADRYKPSEGEAGQQAASPKASSKQSWVSGTTPLKQLKTLGVLGKGAFGFVTLVKDPKTGDEFALKAIRKKQVVEMQQQQHIVNEKNVMEKLDCPFLVNLRGVYKDEYRVYFLLEVCLGGELFTILRRKRYFNEPTAKFYTACVVEAFAYMHGKRIIYRDLKPENLVLDSAGYLKVTDFGFAKVVNDKTFTLCGTPDYLAPEIVTGQGHGKGVDWWTLGILIYEMLASFPPFFDEEPIETYRKIIKCRIKFPRYFTSEAKNLIKSLLRSKAVKRLGVLKGGAKNIRAHPWFKNFSWEELNAMKMRPPIVPRLDNGSLNNFSQNVKDDGGEMTKVSDKIIDAAF